MRLCPDSRNPSVFDLCSGKGGDNTKWIMKKPSHYIALEFQEKLVLEADKRMFESLQREKFKRNQRD